MSRPVPTTAMLLDAPASPPRCAAASMPSASPLTIVSPASDSARAEALRVRDALLRRVAAADDREGRRVEELDAAFRVQERRRIGDVEQRLRIRRVAERDDVVRRVFEPVARLARAARAAAGASTARTARSGTTCASSARLAARISCGPPKRDEKLPERVVRRAPARRTA